MVLVEIEFMAGTAASKLLFEYEIDGYLLAFEYLWQSIAVVFNHAIVSRLNCFGQIELYEFPANGAQGVWIYRLQKGQQVSRGGEGSDRG